MLPIVASAIIGIRVVEERTTDRIETDLANVRRLEAARIEDALEDYCTDAEHLAFGPHVRDFTTTVVGVRNGTLPQDTVVGGVDQFAPVDPWSPGALDELAAAMRQKAQSGGGEVLEVQIVGRDGTPLGQTPGFSWEPTAATLVERAMSAPPNDPRAVFGQAYRVATDDARLGVVAPILSSAGDSIVGAVLLETQLGPIVDLVTNHEGFGETSEAHIAQPLPDGRAQFLTLLRFRRDAAFTAVPSLDKPIVQALNSPGGQVIRDTDYRNVDSFLAMETIEATGWGLVVKVDAAEALATVDEIRRLVLIGTAGALIVLFAGWLVLARPMVRRLHNVGVAAQRVAAGNHDHRCGDPRRDEIGVIADSIDRLAATLQDDVIQRIETDTELVHRATHDGLTGLVNRLHAQQIAEELSTEHDEVTVLFVDLDRFKAINDTHGHSVGDEVLAAVADRLRDAVGVAAIVARWGGDEFVVFLPETGAVATLAINDRLGRVLQEPIATSAGTLQVRSSIGHTVASGTRSVSAALHEADQQMFVAKARNGRSRPSADALVIVAEALEQNRIEVWYQPIVRAVEHGHQTLVGIEALVRLRRVDGSVVPPKGFLDDIVDHPLSAALDRRVAAVALADLAGWRACGLVDGGVRLSVNVGAASINDLQLASTLLGQCDQLGVPPHLVVVELNEDIPTIDRTTVDRLRAAGFGVAIDDVGLRRSNFDRLVSTRASIAKIDRQWLGGTERAAGADERIVLPRLVDTCRQLGMTVVAEGVERLEQVAELHALDVDLFQGFLFSTPLPRHEFEGLLASAELTHDLDQPALPRVLITRSGIGPTRRGLPGLTALVAVILARS